VSGRLRVSAGEGIREGVLAGLGFAIASEWLFAPELKSVFFRRNAGHYGCFV
jgi:DNA-binding transcriptional LysR family regulator